MKYCFEKYEYCNRGRVFHGYISVDANDSDEATQLAQLSAGQGIVLQPVYINPSDSYSR